MKYMNLRKVIGVCLALLLCVPRICFSSGPLDATIIASSCGLVAGSLFCIERNFFPGTAHHIAAKASSLRETLALPISRVLNNFGRSTQTESGNLSISSIPAKIEDKVSDLVADVVPQESPVLSNPAGLNRIIHFLAEHKIMLFGGGLIMGACIAYYYYVNSQKDTSD